MKVLIIGYGNADRQDDGVAYHVLTGILEKLGLPLPADSEDESLGHTGIIDFRFQLQLTPELSEELVDYDFVCFLDAHTGNVPEDVHFEEVSPLYQRSPFTHHMTAQTLLSMTQAIHHKAPTGILVSVRGKEFGFMQSLSVYTNSLVPIAVDKVIQWLDLINAH